MTINVKQDFGLQSNRGTSYWVNSIVVLVLMFGFRYLPTLEPMTDLGMQIAGIFLGMLYGWMTVGLAWPSILGMIAVGLSDYSNVTQAFGVGFSNMNTMLVFFLLALTAVLDLAGITKWIGAQIISSSLTKGRPWVLTFFILLASLVLNVLTGTSGAIMIVWSISYGIFEIFGFKEGEKWPMIVVFGVAVAGGLGFQMFAFKPQPVVVLGTLQSLSGITVNSMSFAAWMFIIDIIIAIAYILGCRFMLKIDVSKIIEANTVIENKEEKLNAYQKMILATFVVYILLMLAPGVLPADWKATVMLNKLGYPGTTALALVFVIFFDFKMGHSFQKNSHQSKV